MGKSTKLCFSWTSRVELSLRRSCLLQVGCRQHYATLCAPPGCRPCSALAAVARTGALVNCDVAVAYGRGVGGRGGGGGAAGGGAAVVGPEPLLWLPGLPAQQRFITTTAERAVLGALAEGPALQGTGRQRTDLWTAAHKPLPPNAANFALSLALYRSSSLSLSLPSHSPSCC